jgi:hypothetical protein
MSYVQTEFVEGSAESGVACELLPSQRRGLAKLSLYSHAEQVLLHLDACLPTVIPNSLFRLLETVLVIPEHPGVLISQQSSHHIIDLASTMRDRFGSARSTSQIRQEFRRGPKQTGWFGQGQPEGNRRYQGGHRGDVGLGGARHECDRTTDDGRGSGMVAEDVSGVGS